MFLVKIRAENETRTRDPNLGKVVLYQLSYFRNIIHFSFKKLYLILSEEALDFLASIPDIQLTPELEDDIRLYAESDVYYPKRYKVRPRVYFIIIKTEAQTMLDFKQKKSYQNGRYDFEKRKPNNNAS